MHRSVTCFAPAKVNLALHVTGQRTDGFHDLDTLVVFCNTGDVVCVENGNARDSSVSLAASGPFAGDLPKSDDNLVIRGARLASRSQGVGGLAMILEKCLPVASGIGGGSADAAAALLAVAEFEGLPVDDASADLAAGLGSDVPMCLQSRSLIARGRGEKIETVLGFDGLNMVLVNPGVAVSTPEVFSRLASRCNPPMTPLPSAGADFSRQVAWLRAQRNDLQAAAVELAPDIASVLEALENAGAALARMSGSGATCFGLFDTADAARQAREQISQAHPYWWTKATTTASFGIERAQSAENTKGAEWR